VALNIIIDGNPLKDIYLEYFKIDSIWT